MSHSYVGPPVAAHLVVIRSWKYSQYLQEKKKSHLGKNACDITVVSPPTKGLKHKIFLCSPGGCDRTHNLPACTHGSAQGAGGCVSPALSLWRLAPSSSLRLAPHWECSHSGALGHSIRCPLSGQPENYTFFFFLLLLLYKIILPYNRTLPYLFPFMLICLRCFTRIWIRVGVRLSRFSVGLVKASQSAPLLQLLLHWPVDLAAQVLAVERMPRPFVAVIHSCTLVRQGIDPAAAPDSLASFPSLLIGCVMSELWRPESWHILDKYEVILLSNQHFN